MSLTNHQYQTTGYQSSSRLTDPTEKVKGCFINTSQVPRANQLILPRLVVDLNLANEWRLTAFYDHIEHTPGIDGSGQNIVNIIQCGSEGERKAFVDILIRTGCSGLEILDEVCPSSLQ